MLLQKSLYGLKQSPRMWYKRLREFLIILGSKESYNDPSLFILIQRERIVYLFAYADDIVLTCSYENFVKDTITFMGKEFTLTELKELGYFLGIQVKKCEQRLHFSQQQYLVNLLNSLG